MEESLILLKKLLCWDVNDVRYFKLNVRLEDARSQMTEATKAKLRQWLWADYALYNHFRHKLDQLIADYGHSLMRTEVEALQMCAL